MVSRMFYGKNPFLELRRLQGDLSRALEAPMPGAPEYPALNVYANPEAAMITAELPGVDSDDLEISVHRETLTIRGSRLEPDRGGQTYHRRERQQGSFVRTVGLPFVVDPDQVEADLDAGVLKLTLNRAEEDKPRRIRIGASNARSRGSKAKRSDESKSGRRAKP